LPKVTQPVTGRVGTESLHFFLKIYLREREYMHEWVGEGQRRRRERIPSHLHTEQGA